MEKGGEFAPFPTSHSSPKTLLPVEYLSFPFVQLRGGWVSRVGGKGSLALSVNPKPLSIKMKNLAIVIQYNGKFKTELRLNMGSMWIYFPNLYTGLLFMFKYLYNSLSDLLGPDSIDDWIKGRWDNRIYISEKNVDIMGNVLTKAVCHKRKKMLVCKSTA